MTREQFTYHIGTFSKLLRGRRSTGPIKKGTESRIVGRSAGWVSSRYEKSLDRLCDPQTFFADTPTVMSMDARLMDGGAFVYRPFVRGEMGHTHYSAFARVEARSENGQDEPGRKYTHWTVLIVEDKWDPELIPWAAEMLFNDEIQDEFEIPWGAPIPEMHKTRLERQLPQLMREELDRYMEKVDLDEWPLGVGSGNKLVTRAGLPRSLDEKRPQIQLGHALASELWNMNLGTHGRWLSFAIGVSRTADAPGPGFAFRLDDRGEDQPSEAIDIPFSDERPPQLTTNALLVPKDANLSEEDVYGVNWARLRPKLDPAHGRGIVTRAPIFGQKQLWIDQDPERRHLEDDPAMAELNDPAGDLGSAEHDAARPDGNGFADAETIAFKSVSAARAPLPQDVADPMLVQDTPTQDPRALGSVEIDDARPRTAPKAAGQEVGRPRQAPHLLTEPSEIPSKDDAPGSIEAQIRRHVADDHLASNSAAALAYMPDPSDYRIAWPTLPDPTTAWVLEDKLMERLRRRFVALTALLSVVDDDEFSTFAVFVPTGVATPDNADAITLFAEAFADVALISFIYATVGQPRDLADPFTALLSHSPIKGFGPPEAPSGSLYALTFAAILKEHIGLKNIEIFIKRRARVARDMARLSNVGSVILTAPEPRDFKAFLGALTGAVTGLGNHERSASVYEIEDTMKRIALEAAELIIEEIAEPMGED